MLRAQILLLHSLAHSLTQKDSTPCAEACAYEAVSYKNLQELEITVEPRLSGPRLSGFLDYPYFFCGPQFGHEYLQVKIKIRSHTLFKTTALKDAVKCEGFLLSESKSSARACRK